MSDIEIGKVVWTGIENEGDGLPIKCELERIVGQNKWYLSLTEGPFSGYPTILLNREHLAELARAIDDELGVEPLFYNDTTMFSVLNAMRKENLPEEKINEIVNSLQNAGILFRERKDMVKKQLRLDG